MAFISSQQVSMEHEIKVLYGGAFDLLHLGHIRAIKQAKMNGDYLVVNVNSDSRVRFKKGELRPVIPDIERAELIKSLRDVDEVVCEEFPNESYVQSLLERVEPDVFIINKGENTAYGDVAKRECAKRGIQLIEQERIIVPSTLDTTRIIAKIKAGSP